MLTDELNFVFNYVMKITVKILKHTRTKWLFVLATFCAIGLLNYLVLNGLFEC